MRGSVCLTGQGYAVKPSASFGVATFPEDAADRTALLALADNAMFAIKKRGKDAVGVIPSGGAARGPLPGNGGLMPNGGPPVI
jgi:hypothetical protein